MLLRRYAAVTLLCLVTVSCFDGSNNSKQCRVPNQGNGIVGAEYPLGQADIRWSSTAAFDLIQDDMRYTCTGVVVAPDLVLTAAHCFSDHVFQSVSFGDDVDRAVRVPIQTYKTHEGWRGVGYNDIAWVRLKKKIPTGAAVVPVLRNPALLEHGTPVTLVGYGKTATDKNVQDTGIKRVTTSQVYDYKHEMVLDNRSLVNAFVVGQTANKGACFGDSGGPAFASFDGRTYVVGTTSGSTAPDELTDTQCERGLGVWTAIADYLPWIERTSGVTLQSVGPALSDDSSDNGTTQNCIF